MVTQAQARFARKHKGQVLTGEYPLLLQDTYSILTGHLVLFPRTFAMGTSRRSYCTCTVSRSAYDEDLEPSPPEFVPNAHDARRSANEDWKYLIKPLSDGEVHVRARGKELFLAAGYHGMRVNFSLEATVLVTTRADFDALTAEDCPGPNTNKSKANNMRRFVIPPQYQEEGSRDKARDIGVFAAIVCEDTAIMVVDFARLVQLHIISLDRHWVGGDLQRDSMLWATLWGLGRGYDWIDETEDALTALDGWRTTVLADSDQEPLVHALCENQQIFNGFGKHTAHDLLHLVAVWPGIPSAVLCHDDSLYFCLKKELVVYAALWVSQEYRYSVCSASQSPNPLRFNYQSDRAYINRYVKVYRKWYVDVPKALHDHLVNQGLLNVDHIIAGQPYTPQPNEFLAPHRRFARLPVHVHKIKKSSLYSVIMAQRPSEWRWALPEDIRHAGFVTTLGPAQFHNTNQNMQVVDGPHPRGRRPRYHCL
ncbi:hypothetical protein B0H21DRAFT_699318 [Amylocystis lapponica]|nr:hypothetical protein B0H21DRAFT_699318 [Amylocystis lapponica]